MRPLLAPSGLADLRALVLAMAVPGGTGTVPLGGGPRGEIGRAHV